LSFIKNLERIAEMCSNDKTAYNIVVLGVIVGLFEIVLLGHAGTETSFVAWWWYSLLTCLALTIADLVIYAISRTIINISDVFAYIFDCIKNLSEE